MTVSTNVIFHGVTWLEIGEITTHWTNGKRWQATTIWLHDKDGPVDNFQVHSPVGADLKITIGRSLADFLQEAEQQQESPLAGPEDEGRPGNFPGTSVEAEGADDYDLFLEAK